MSKSRIHANEPNLSTLIAMHIDLTERGTTEEDLKKLRALEAQIQRHKNERI